MTTLTDLKTITYDHGDYRAALGDNTIGYFKNHLDAENALNAHTLDVIMSGVLADDPGGPEPPGDDIPGPGDPLPPAVCEKCNRPRKTLTRYTYGWWCGTCISRYERHQNVQDRYGRGRRGY